ncbi:MAG: hypothetical protein JST48_06545 [Bacteroidetes bacterium]|nr:hypothetical protein [Bacteroidota bacterium]
MGRYTNKAFSIAAILLIAANIGYSIPDYSYSQEKTFIKSPVPQSEGFSFLANDSEDRADLTSSLFLYPTNIFRFLFSNFQDQPDNTESYITERLFSLPPYLLLRRLLL